MQKPFRNRIYQNHHLDSTLWEAYSPKAGDVIVSTSYKSGTTWMQQILHALLHRNYDASLDLSQISPWIEWRFGSAHVDILRQNLLALPDRRFLKTHLPFDGLPYYEQVRYIVIGRDPRDVFMSMFNHYRNYTEAMFGMLNAPQGRKGQTIPSCPDDPCEFWRNWISKGFFEWESEGWPFWANLGHTQSYWNYRQLPNLLLIHYADMLTDIGKEIRRIADFLEVHVTDEDVARITEATAFKHVKKKAAQVSRVAEKWRMVFKGGLDAFFYKGTNGRWRDVLSADDLALYEEAKKRVLSMDCAHWLENGSSSKC